MKKNFNLSDTIVAFIEDSVMDVLGTGEIPDNVLSTFVTNKYVKQVEVLNISPGITYIGENTFEGFPNLKKVNIWNVGKPNTLTIKKDAFICPNVESVFLSMPANIEDGAFSSSTEFIYSKPKMSISMYVDNDELAKNKEEYMLLTYSRGEIRIIGIDESCKTRKKSKAFPSRYMSYIYPATAISIEKAGTIPGISTCYNAKYVIADEYLTSLPTGIFNGWKNLKIATLPNLEEIPSFAFYESGLKYIHIGSATKMLNKDCFCNAKDLSIVKFDKNEYIQSISKEAFYQNKQLKEIDLKPLVNLKFIRMAAFSCTGLKEINLPDNVEEIDTRAFENSKIKEFVFPKECKIVSNSVFKKCKNLKKVIANEKLKEIGTFAFNLLNIDELDLSRCSISGSIYTIITNCKIGILKLPKFEKSRNFITYSQIDKLFIADNTSIDEEFIYEGKIKEIIFGNNVSINARLSTETNIDKMENLPANITITAEGDWIKGDTLLYKNLDSYSSVKRVSFDIPECVKRIKRRAIFTNIAQTLTVGLPKEIYLETSSIIANIGNLYLKIADDCQLTKEKSATSPGVGIVCSESKFSEIMETGWTHCPEWE